MRELQLGISQQNSQTDPSSKTQKMRKACSNQLLTSNR